MTFFNISVAIKFALRCPPLVVLGISESCKSIEKTDTHNFLKSIKYIINFLYKQGNNIKKIPLFPIFDVYINTCTCIKVKFKKIPRSTMYDL